MLVALSHNGPINTRFKLIVQCRYQTPDGRKNHPQPPTQVIYLFLENYIIPFKRDRLKVENVVA